MHPVGGQGGAKNGHTFAAGKGAHLTRTDIIMRMVEETMQLLSAANPAAAHDDVVVEQARDAVVAVRRG